MRYRITGATTLWILEQSSLEQIRTKSINLSVGDLYVGTNSAGETVGAQVPIDYAVATISLGNITLDNQTLQINQNLAEQTWVFP